MTSARRRDRRVYTAAHPVLLGLLTATRRVPLLRLGGTVLVHGTEAYREVLTCVPLDRVAAGTTGGAARALDSGGVLFDQAGLEHRAARRQLAEDLGADGVRRLRPAWLPMLEAAAQTVGDGERLDVVALARRLAGTTTAALLALDVDPDVLATAALAAAAATVGSHLPSLRSAPDPRPAVDRLTALVGEGRNVMVALATVSTTVAAVPRAVAWTTDADLWSAARDPQQRPVLAAELLRVLAPSPVLPRAAAADVSVLGRPVRQGDRLVLVARSAARAHLDPSPTHPQPPRVQSLVFGAGPHACPGAALARAQLVDVLAAFAPHAPRVVRAVPDRTAALPAWAVLEVAR